MENVIQVEDILLNDNILVLIEKLERLTEIQFHYLVLFLTILILAIIYYVIKQFIR